MTTIRVILADDHPTVRAGIRSALMQTSSIEVMAEASSGQEALRLIKIDCPDVVLLDCRLPGELDGIAVAEYIQTEGWSTQIVALSAFDDDILVHRMLKAGAIGYVLKQEALERVVEAIQAAARGENWFSAPVATKIAAWARGKQPTQLTEHELDVMRLVVAGKTDRQIGWDLGLAERTVRYHLRNIYDKLGVNTRTEAVAQVMRLEPILLA